MRRFLPRPKGRGIRAGDLVTVRANAQYFDRDEIEEFASGHVFSAEANEPVYKRSHGIGSPFTRLLGTGKRKVTWSAWFEGPEYTW